MPQNERFEIMDENADHIFSNLISFNINAEECCLGIGIRDLQDPKLINIHTYLHMTVPHFLRFAEAVNEQVNILIERGVVSRREPEQ